MKKTKAAFRAIREECGLTQQDLADVLDVRVMTVKRWENPGSDVKEPPDDAWEQLLTMRASMIDEAWSAADAVCERARAASKKEVVLFYYRTQEMLDERSASGRRYGYVNAIARKTADLIQAEGFDVIYAYAGEEVEFSVVPGRY